jgi:hypothetical protein
MRLKPEPIERFYSDTTANGVPVLQRPATYYKFGYNDRIENQEYANIAGADSMEREAYEEGWNDAGSDLES